MIYKKVGKLLLSGQIDGILFNIKLYSNTAMAINLLVHIVDVCVHTWLS